MADQSRPLKNTAYDLYFCVYKNDGTVIANPGGLAGRIVCAAHTSGAATDNAPTVVDSTGGICKLSLTAAEMDSDYVAVKVTSTDTGAVAACFTIFPAASQVAVPADVTAAQEAVIAALPDAAAVADAVWDEATTGHTTDNTFGDSLSEIHAGVLPACASTFIYLTNEVKDELDLIKAKTDTIGALAVTVSSPVAASGDITVFQGDDYAAADSRAITATVPVADVPDLTGADLRFKCSEASWTATSCASDGEHWTIAFEPTAAETGLLRRSQQNYEVEATLSDGAVVTLARGTLVVVSDIPASG